MPLPRRIPITPPTAVRNDASSRNCQRISFRFAPIARRVPISRVRSVTEMVMIAMTPMPPTSRATDDDDQREEYIWSELGQPVADADRCPNIPRDGGNLTSNIPKIVCGMTTMSS